MGQEPNPTAGAPDADADPVPTWAAEAGRQLQAGDAIEAFRLATRVIEANPRNWQAWDVLARAAELQMDFEQAFSAYSNVLKFHPKSQDVFAKLGRVALGFDNYAVAEKCLSAQLGRTPDAVDVLANLARAQIGQGAFDLAFETLKAGLKVHPAEASLWTLLGRLLCRRGQAWEATVFFEEAVRLEPASTSARDGLADALLIGAGAVDRAIEEGAAALSAAHPPDKGGIAEAHAKRLLSAGRLSEGWALLCEALEGGRDYGVEFKVAAPRWTPADALGGGQLLVFGEDRICDEIQFSQALPRLLAEGPPLVLAIDPRWSALARRSFPGALIVPLHRRRRLGLRQYAAAMDAPQAHGGRPVDAWTTLRSIVSADHADIADFADAQPYLTPDPDLVPLWTAWLDSLGPGPKAGVIWREREMDAHATPDILTMPGLPMDLRDAGIQLVSLQEGASDGELAAMREAFGLEVHVPPGLDPGVQLDELAALTCALDVTIGPRCTATAIAAACGARTWFLAASRSWPLLGTDRYPWHPGAEVFSGSTPDEWADATARLGAAMIGLGERPSPRSGAGRASTEQTDAAQGTQVFQSLCVQDDTFLSEIIQTSLRVFHTSLRWPGYPRTLEEDFQRAVDLTNRANVCPTTGKVRWFFMPCSDPARIPWEGAADPMIADSLGGSDLASLAERGLIGQPEFLLIFFGGYLTHAGDFSLAETFYRALIAHGLEAEGCFGLADIRHTLANWREERREYEDRGVYPEGMPIPADFQQDPIARLREYDLSQAIAFYERAVRASTHVSFYRLHLARARIDQGDLEGGRADLRLATEAANPNPFVGIGLNFIERLIKRLAKSSGDFLPTPELRARYHTLVAAPLTDTETLARFTGSEPVALADETRLQARYVAVVDGLAVERSLDLDYPAPKGLVLAAVRDLGLGLKLASDQYLIAEGPPIGRRRLKLFARPVLMTGTDHALVGLPLHQDVLRSDNLLTPLPGAIFNYYHWIIDAMGAVSLLDRKTGLATTEFIANRPLHTWQRDILELAAPGLNLRVLPGPTEHRLLENAFHLPAPARLNVPHPEAVRLLRERMSRHGSPRIGKRVWVGRAGTRGRMTVNERAVGTYLASHGFETFDPADKSLAEQIAYFSDVEVLVSLAGAALTNLLFCPAETKVVILSTAFHYHETFTALAGAIGQPCWACLAGSETRPNPYLIWSVFDQEVRLEDLSVAVEQALRS